MKTHSMGVRVPKNGFGPHVSQPWLVFMRIPPVPDFPGPLVWHIWHESHCFRKKIPCPSCTSWPAHQVLKPRSWTSPVPAQNPRSFIGFPLKIGCPKKNLWIISVSYHGLASFSLWSGSKLGPHFKIFQGNMRIEDENSHEFLSTRLQVERQNLWVLTPS